MSRKRKDPRQQNLFDFNVHFHIGSSSASDVSGTKEQLSDFDFELRRILKMVLEDCARRDKDPLDRVEVAARMSRKLGRDITKTHIDGWIAMSSIERRIHVDSLKALCDVTADYRPMHFFTESCGFKALDPDMAKCAEYGAQTALMEKLKSESKGIKQHLDDPRLLEKLLSNMIKDGGRS